MSSGRYIVYSSTGPAPNGVAIQNVRRISCSNSTELQRRRDQAKGDFEQLNRYDRNSLMNIARLLVLACMAMSGAHCVAQASDPALAPRQVPAKTLPVPAD